MDAVRPRLHWHPLSGHSHRARLMLSLLGLNAQFIEVDLKNGAHKAPTFLQLNPFGQVPVLEDGDAVIADSNAILVHLALKHDPSGRWYPRDPVQAARVQRWLSAAAGPIAAGPAAARIANVFGVPTDRDKAKAVATALFAVLEAEFDRELFLTGSHPTIADVAVYTYTAHAPEGDISLEPYPGIRDWLMRIEALDGFVPMQRFAPST